ncbi:MAG: HD domain-containing protein [Planctomycetota bacterium]|nr:HD domain-containing protein [Planctomycetota bacterium]
MNPYRQQVEQNSARLEAQVRRRTRELEASRQEAILCLARAAEYRDDDTGKHVIRVGRYAGILCRKLGISERVATLVEQAAQLHDMGKIGIPDAILLKPGRLEAHEFDIMKNHCPIGRKIIQPLTDREWKTLRQHTHMAATILGIPSSPIMKMAAVIAQTHHEKWDGSGYPLGLQGEEIPLEGRIVALADVYDALSSERPYKKAFTQEKCCEIIREGSGKHFDPRIADAFFASLGQISQVQSEFADAEGHFLGARVPSR